MSNTLAISTVSAAFSRKVLAAANQVVAGTTVRLGAPTAKLAEDGKPLVNLHLYRVEPNTAQSNSHLPSRSASGQTRQPSQLVLNLHYVLSFYGNHEDFEPDLILGAVMLALEDQPVLSKSTVAGAIANNDALEDSDLGAALARLRVTRELMTLDDFSKVWSIFYQVPYAISLAYEVSHVVIQAYDPAPVATPVAQPGLWVAPLAGLRLDKAGGAPDGAGPAVWGGVLQVLGQGLGQPELGLRVDDLTLVTDAVEQGATTLSVPLEIATFGGDTLDIGVHRLQAIAPARPGQPDHLRPRSNALAFALHPAITLGAVAAPLGGDTATGTVTVTFSPPVQSAQTVRLLLDARDAAAPAHIALPGRDPAEGGVAQNALSFEFADLARGAYLVRAEVDGLVSPVAIDPDPASATYRQIIGPVLSL